MSTLAKQLRSQLTEAVSKRNLHFDDEKIEQLLHYLELLHKWNGIHNLTAVRDPMEMIERHILDSLTLYPWIMNAGIKRIADVGTGAGLPGLILAICLPHCSFVLIDSQQKKVNFVQHVILSLKLNNVSVVCTRIEQYKPSEKFDWVISRAFASLATFATSAGHLLKKDGRLVAMKGQLSDQELAELKDPYIIERCEPIVDPGVKQPRCLIFIRRNL